MSAPLKLFVIVTRDRVGGLLNLIGVSVSCVCERHPVWLPTCRGTDGGSWGEGLLLCLHFLAPKVPKVKAERSAHGGAWPASLVASLVLALSLPTNEWIEYSVWLSG